MKKGLIMMMGAMLLLSSCGTYTAEGASTGGWFGSIIGSAIGGIAGGPRGSDIGTLVGMAGGAAVGAAIGQAADNARQQKYERYEGRYNHSSSTYDDVIDIPEMSAGLEIRNPRIMDTNRDGMLSRGEEARMVFEIFNNSQKTIYRVQPAVAEVTGNRHIHISENILIESIPAGKGVRYTATVKADRSLRNGEAVIRIGVFQGNREIASQTREFPIRTSRY